jgi:hypothetical protein
MEEEATLTLTPEARRTERIRQWIDLLSAVLMAVATIATAWCGYQSASWGGEQTTHDSRASTAIVRAGEFNNLALQKTSVHVNLFGQWVAATSTDNTKLADFLFDRFPEPLKSATVAWRATDPLNDPSAPASPFDMPEYALRDRAEADRWEQIAIDESVASERASEYSDRYLVFTIIFASVLFFAGISGKFKWQAIDIAVLVVGALVLLIGLATMLSTPLA